ncbi:hypothetical protein [Bradyrhizobium sp. 21]|uniref:hypothetical protein n=1 Tax=Bradyrhizobium sp. 21 TaxID=2782666 RepID=UPI001FF9E8DD|nr:hypothetical protein [Bradyrhizobium sp. 21]MCK1386358.1 hypothetical protein [Bradyrhizobium sp. 21]
MAGDQTLQPENVDKRARSKKRNEAELRMIVATNSQDPSQPPQIMTGGSSNEFAPAIGRIISSWSMLELETDILITAILLSRQDQDIKWRGRQFGRRWDCLHEMWRDFASTNRFLLDEMHRANKSVKAARHTRNQIAHSPMAFGVSDKGPWVRFRNRNPSFPWSKTYFAKELAAVEVQIVEATGRIFRFTARDYASHFPEESLQLLTILPNMDHVRLSVD